MITLTEVEKSPLVGEFNTNYFVIVSGSTALLRIPRRNDSMLASLVNEYRSLGFLNDGGRIRRRTLEEQYALSRWAAMEGLRVLPPLSFDGKNITYPFLPFAITLNHALKSPSVENMNSVVFKLIQDLHTAHSKRVIYGDRWAGNILVDPTFGILHIDFDIELLGPHAHELEIAQVIYHTLWSGGLAIIPSLVDAIFKYRNGWFDILHLSQYLRGFARYLNKTKVGGLEDETELFIYTLNALMKKNSS